MVSADHCSLVKVGASAGLTTTLVTTAVLAGPAARAASSQAACVSTFTVSLTPALNLTESTFRYSSNGPDGMVRCVGTIGGHAVTGPGTIWDEGIGHGSCNGGTVEGFHEYRIPTEAGVVTFRLPVKGIYHAVAGVRDPAESYPGGFVFYPTKGDCVTAPASTADVVAYGFVL